MKPPTDSTFAPLLREDETCWRRERAGRLALLIDGQQYFDAIDHALARASRSVLITGWDLCSRVDLTPGREPSILVERLNGLARKRRDLHIHLLDWDYPFVYALDREFLPSHRLGWRTHRRVHFHLDSTHPFGASHHQKLVVIDDRVAFSGGMDLTDERWDTREHRPDDERRRTVHGQGYDPYHDVQAVVDGDVARALGDLVRERWREATGDVLEPPDVDFETGEDDPWPETEPLLRDVDVGIARTVPLWRDQAAVREVERLYLRSIEAARDHVFIENQYFTSESVARVLERRLAEADGPEVVLLLPMASGRWLEDSTMGVRRQIVLDRLAAADRHGRLLVRAPVTCVDDRQVPIRVHSKVMIVDNRLLRVGSSNTSNRSMRLDTECDLAVEAAGDRAEEVSLAIAGVRDDLLGEHLGVDPERVTEAVRAEGTIGGAVAALSESSSRRRLLPLTASGEWQWLHELVPADAIADPEQPFEPEAVADHLLHDHRSRTRAGRLRPHLPLILLLGVLLGLAGTWRWGPLSDTFDTERVAGWLQQARGIAWTPLAGVVACAAGSLLLVPLALLTLGCVVAVGPWLGFGAFYVGMLVGAIATYGLGRLVGSDLLRRVSSGRFGRLRTILQSHGVLTIAALRLVPLAPFGVVNAVAGHLGVPFGAYFMGTLVGMLPGTLVVVLFGTAIETTLVDEPSVLVWCLATLLVMATGAVWMLRARWQRVLAHKATSNA